MATIQEMFSFVYDERWKAQAESGEHDDLVMSLGIAHMIRSQQRYTVEVEKHGSSRKWTADMWEDWRHANEEMKRMLIEKWGEPR